MPDDNFNHDPSPRGEKLIAQYWALYLRLGKITEAVLPPDQLRELKMAFYTGMSMMVDCIGRGQLLDGLEKMEADNGEYYSNTMQALYQEMTDFMNNELPILTLKAEIHLNIQV
jgi:hypothetical protein